MTWGGLPAAVPAGYIAYFVLPAAVGVSLGRWLIASFQWRAPVTFLTVGLVVGSLWAFAFNAILGAQLGVFYYGRVIEGLAIREGTIHQYPLYDAFAMGVQMDGLHLSARADRYSGPHAHRSLVGVEDEEPSSCVLALARSHRRHRPRCLSFGVRASSRHQGLAAANSGADGATVRRRAESAALTVSRETEGRLAESANEWPIRTDVRRLALVEKLKEIVMNRVAVVTGGASGIGLAIGQRLAAAGHAVALLDIDADTAVRAAGELAKKGARVRAYEADVADRKALERVFEAVRKDLGPIGILVTSAGMESFDLLQDITPEKWERLLAVNLTGTFTCAQLAAKDMIAAEWGRIVTISSSSAQSGAPMMAHYVASKAGVIGLTRALAFELAQHKITVNTIPPTIVDTPMARKAEASGAFPFGSIDNLVGMVPLGRLGTPDDIAATAAFLCSEEAGYITGQVIGVNGGMRI